MVEGKLRFFAGTSNPALAVEISEKLGVSLGNILIRPFSDGETFVKVLDNVRGGDIYILQSLSPPVNQNLMELLIMVDAFRRSSAKSITAVVPYYGYARQDRKVEARVPITSKLVANLCVVAGINRLVTMDLHAGQIQGFFDIPVDHLYANPVMLEYFKQQAIEDLVVVSPDAGGVERARAFAKRIGSAIAIIDKRRTEYNEAEIMNVIGEIHGKNALILDDIIDTAGTLTKAAAVLGEKGAKNVYAAGTHAILSGPAIERIQNSNIKELIVTDSIPLPKEKQIPQIKVLSVAGLLAEAIKRIHEHASVSSLFV